MTWSERAAKNLFPLSRNQAQLKMALSEWAYTGDTFDLEATNGTCELCDQPNLRYQFQIENRFTGHDLLVGSECINRFEIRAKGSSGQILDTESSRKRVNRDRRSLISDARKKRLIETLVELASKDSEFSILSFIDYVQERGAFTPNQAGLLIWRLNRCRIKYNKSDFKVIMRRNREKDQLKHMADWKLKQLWPVLTSSQQTWVLENTSFQP